MWLLVVIYSMLAASVLYERQLCDKSNMSPFKRSSYNIVIIIGFFLLAISIIPSGIVNINILKFLFYGVGIIGGSIGLWILVKCGSNNYCNNDETQT